MDINYLLAREQIELFNATKASDPRAKEVHLGLAHLYRRQREGVRPRPLAANVIVERPVIPA